MTSLIAITEAINKNHKFLFFSFYIEKALFQKTII